MNPRDLDPRRKTGRSADSRQRRFPATVAPRNGGSLYSLHQFPSTLPPHRPQTAAEPIQAALSAGLSRTLIRRELLRRIDELHAALCDRK